MDNLALNEAIPIPETVYNNQNNKICHVGYALNQKKLRKSRRIKNESRPSTPSSCSSSSSSLSLKTIPLPSSLIWQGGGLADIIFGSNQDGSSVIDNVKFSPFDWNSVVNTVNTNTKGNNHHKKTARATAAISSSGTSILSTSSPHFHDNNDDDDMSIHYDVIIHKLTEDLEKPYDTSSVDKIHRLQTYLKTHPRTIIIDPLESVKKVTSRLRSCENIGQIQPSPYFQHNGIYCHLTQPNYFIINEHDDSLLLQSPSHSTSSSSSSSSSESCNNDSKSNTCTAKFLQLMTDHNITFPIICKPLLACGSADAHIMSIILHPLDLSLIRTPCLVQQYYNHDSRLYKVYVIGEDVMVFQRPSLPDLHLVPYGGSNNHNNNRMNNQQAPQQEQYLSLPTTIQSDKADIAMITSNKQINIKHNNDSSSNNSNTSTCNGERAKCKCYRDGQKTAVTAPCHHHKLKSVIFDSRLTYPTLNDFLVDSSSGESSVDETTLPTSFNTEVNSQNENNSKRCKNHNSDNNNGSTNNDAVTNNNIDDATSRSQNHCIIMINNDNNNNSHNESSSNSGDDDGLPVPLDCFKHAAKLVSQQFGLSLFGFDVIFSVDDDGNVNGSSSSSSSSVSSSSLSSSPVINKEQNQKPSHRRLIVVDVNYFPSYKEVPDFPSRLRRLLKTASSSSSIPSSSAIVPSSSLLT